jgi:hypothetical protein
MVSVRVRQALQVAAALLALAAYANALRAADDAIADRERQFLATIQEILTRDGPYSPELLAPLAALIELYRGRENDALAAVTIERARQVVRVNDGLHALEQVPYLEQLIRIERARGNHATAWNLQQELLALVRRHPEDLRTVPVLREDAERHMEVLAQYLGGERPPELYLGCYYQGDCNAGQRRVVAQGMIADAGRSYMEAIAVLTRNEHYDSDELRELEVARLRGLDLLRTQFGGELGAYGVYYPVRQSLYRLYEYETAASRPLLSQANAAVRIADWELLYSNNGDAIDRYALVRRTLQKAGASPAQIDELFLPDLPVVLPAFQPNPLASDESKSATGHIDVAFEITKYGRGRDVEILDAANATREAKNRLVSLISLSRFRPRPTNGEFVGDSRVVLRYYLYVGASD